MHEIVLGSEFGKAICQHFGINPMKVSSDFKINAGPDEIFSVTLNITLSPEDISSIGKIMEG